MADPTGKTPYEIRLELLKLAQDYVANNYAQQQYWVEKQTVILQDMMNLMNKEVITATEEFNKNYEKTVSDMKRIADIIPTQETILDTAKKFQEFVNKRN